MIAQFAVHLGLVDTGMGAEVTAWFGRDLRIVVDAALRLAERGDTYYLGTWPEGFDVYNYTPFYALLISQIATRLAFPLHAFLHGIVNLLAYIMLFFSWRKIFPLIGLPEASHSLVTFLPLWLIYERIWSDTLLLNVYIILALIASWLFVFVWQERLIPAAILLVLILQIKPQWAFALGLPLVLGRFRFFFKLLLTTLAGYLGIVAVTILLLGWDYGIAQYRDYYTMLAVAPLKISWHGPEQFIGYDHSIAQIYFYLLGYHPSAWPIVRLIKLALIAPLGIVTVLAWLPPKAGKLARADHAFEAFFALYFAAFIWLDLVWEITLAIILFHYLWSGSMSPRAKWAFGLPFLLYALADIWRAIGMPLSALLMGLDTIAALGPPIWADPLFRIPVIMIVILTAYFLLTARLFRVISVPERV